MVLNKKDEKIDIFAIFYMVIKFVVTCAAFSDYFELEEDKIEYRLKILCCFYVDLSIEVDYWWYSKFEDLVFLPFFFFWVGGGGVDKLWARFYSVIGI